jgi:hypothetical protein
VLVFELLLILDWAACATAKVGQSAKNDATPQETNKSPANRTHTKRLLNIKESYHSHSISASIRG